MTAEHAVIISISSPCSLMSALFISYLFFLRVEAASMRRSYNIKRRVTVAIAVGDETRRVRTGWCWFIVHHFGCVVLAKKKKNVVTRGLGTWEGCTLTIKANVPQVARTLRGFAYREVKAGFGSMLAKGSRSYNDYL